MKIPKIFIPDKNLDVKVEELAQEKSITSLSLKDLIYEGIGIIGDQSSKTECLFNAILKFNEGTEVSLHYTPEPFYEKDLTLIEGSNLGLKSIMMTSIIGNPVEAIERTFSENPFSYEELPFQHTEFELEDKIIPKVNKKMFKKNEPTIFNSELVIDRMAFKPEDKGESYKINIGSFYRIVRSRNIVVKKGLKDKILETLKDKILGGSLCFHTMSIYQALPFTEKEKELLAGLKNFKVSYRFPKPLHDTNDSKHLFHFEIGKKENTYKALIRIDDGFASGLDLESVWQAENLFDYLRLTKTINHFDMEVYKRSTQQHGTTVKIF